MSLVLGYYIVGLRERLRLTPSTVRFMKLSLQGYTFCGSSGDYGVASHPLTNTTGCISASNVTHDIQNGTIFNPQFPDNCPYVLGEHQFRTRPRL